MNRLDPEDAIFLVDAFLDECKVNNIISVVEKHTNYMLITRSKTIIDSEV